MKLAASIVLLAAIATARAQQPAVSPAPAPFTDPANLRGERVKPRDGRELPIDTGTLGLQQLLRKLSTRASILNIVAHPDDEDGGMLTLYARGLGARVADLSLTRGEGGQNAMTGDFEDALGLLRTQELLANDRYTGVDQMFGTEVDFGFSKTKSEAFAKWTHDRVLYDAVRAIRLFRPLVITATFIGGVTDGHGQHQVSGQIAQEAFKAAGDPTVFPEMIAEGILPWQPLKVYARVPTQSITDKGLYDYATNQFMPARFTNYVTGEVTATPPSADVTVHEGTPDSLLTTAAANPADLSPALASQTTPLSYIQFARIGLGLQKSQIGPGVRTAPTGTFDVAYHLYGSCLPNSPTLKLCHLPKPPPPPVVSSLDIANSEDPRGYYPGPYSHANSFFDGMNLSYAAILYDDPAAFTSDRLSKSATLIENAVDHFDPAHPDRIAPLLATTLNDINELIQTVETSSSDPTAKANALHELRIKRVQLNDALTLALGITFDANSAALESNVLLGEGLSVMTTLTAQAKSVSNGLQHLATPSAPNIQGIVMLQGDSVVSDSAKREKLTANAQYLNDVSRPYFFRDNIEQPVYQLRVPSLRNAPETPAALTAWASLNYLAVPLEVSRIVHSGPQPVSIVPPASLSISAHAQVLPISDDKIFLTLHESDNGSPIVSEHEGAPKDWQSLSTNTSANCAGCVPIAYQVPAGNRHTVTLHPSIDLKDGTVITEGFRSVGYAGLPRTNYFTPATDRIVPVDLKFPESLHRFPADPTGHYRIGYLPGTGDDVPQALNSIGVYTRTLTVADLTPANLAQFDTVILGVRTYNAHPDLHGAPTQALLDYARSGGNVVVQYQTPEFTAADAPYPLSLGSNEKVVDETAPVQLLDTTSPLLTAPNQLTPADFNNWIAERGHGFLSTWDTHYTALTETHDPGQADQRGGLITTPLGPDPKHQGRWTYVAFALYRQLPEAVPGAYRLFLNLLNP
jgi:LmbE family N-acetylglucosaminyl deacetylase